VTDTGLALVSASSPLLKFWGKAFVFVVHIIKALPKPVLNNVGSYEKLFSIKNDYILFKIICCACYLLLHPYNQHKFDFLSSLFLFLGYNYTYKSYIFLTSSGKTIISRHVIVNEYLFPYTMPDNPFNINVTASSVSCLHYTPLTIIFSTCPSTTIINYTYTFPSQAIVSAPSLPSSADQVSLPTTNHTITNTHHITGAERIKNGSYFHCKMVAF